MSIITDLSKPVSEANIELRIGKVKQGSGFALLAYKTARTDIQRFNDVCGLLWKDRYFYDEKKILTCEISVYDEQTKQWITRADVGTESNIESEKGSYSDAFKRAAVKFGVGSELYGFPFIWISWKNWDGKYPSCQYDIKGWTVKYSSRENMTMTIFDSKGGKVWSNAEKLPTGNKTSGEKGEKQKKVTKPADDTEEDVETLRGQAMGFHHALINNKTLNFGEASRLSNKHLGVTKPEEAADISKLKMYIEDCKELLKAK